MASVFIPVTFISGSTGVFFKQFGITIAIAIILSAINALTLSPALGAIFLKPLHENGKKQGGMHIFYTLFNKGFEATKEKYMQTVSFFSRKKWIAVLVVLFFSGLFAILMEVTPSGFVPEEDMGTIFVSISLPPAASMERTTIVADQVADISKSIPGVNSVLRMVGMSMMAGNGSSYAMVICELKNWHDREGITNVDIIQEIMQKTSAIKDATIMPFSMPTIMGFGMSGGFSFQLQDKGGHNIDEFYIVSQDFLAELSG